MTRADGADRDPDVQADPTDVAASEREAPDAPVADGGETGRAELVPASAPGLVRYDPFRRYLAEARRYAPLSREEERELARRYRDTGDRDALFRLVTANLMLVVRIAFSFRRAAHNMLDLVQEGNLGLLHAIDRFDPELGVRLPTYAAWWVRAYMVKFLLDNVRLVRVGTTNARRKLLRNLRQEKLRLERLGYDVGPRLLAEHFGVNEQDVTDVRQALESRDVSLDEPLGADGGAEDRRQVDVLPDESVTGAEELVARNELQERAERAIAEFRRGLTEREAAILDRRILNDDPETLQAIGERFGTTREAVRQAETRLMKRLTKFMRERLGDLGQVKIGPR
jgi:RNA polymerase sigma-32 factor